MRIIASLLAALMLAAGCAPSLPANPAAMTGEQIREWVKDKSANITCATVATPYKGTVIALNLDKGIVVNGSVKVSDGCEVTITNTAPPK